MTEALIRQLEKVVEVAGARLTEAQRRFTEAYMRDPKSSTLAARAAQIPDNLRQRAYLWLKTRNVVVYLEALRALALARSEPALASAGDMMLRADQTIADSNSLQRQLTAVARGSWASMLSDDFENIDLGDGMVLTRENAYLVREMTVNEGSNGKGETWRRINVKLRDPERATDLLNRMQGNYVADAEASESAKRAAEHMRAFMAALPADTLKAAHLRALEPGAPLLLPPVPVNGKGGAH